MAVELAMHADRREFVRSEVLELVSHGWGVVPGSVWDGQRYTQGHTGLPTVGLVPVMVSGRSMSVAREAWSWWSVAPYGVLARVGEKFEVLNVSSDLVSAALATDDGATRSCPVMRSPDGDSARLIVTQGTRLCGALGCLAGVTLVRGGSLVPLPPTETADGAWSWWIHPADVGYRSGNGTAVQDALISQVRGGWV
ncbi:hypothetical protein [Amycolatopsis sp.]|jgi:hypothetical protein|uniref:hypothetical protein n=1 Tax=Amycolatopsis sp. TaxID=37632 RepID=UPI002DFBDF54|nr:hypothetical protein [Amycolatopsis sp.]